MEEGAGNLPADSLPRAVPAPEALSEEAMSEEALTAALQAIFGFSSYRRLQLPVIQSVLRGQNTFAIMPTGDCSHLSSVLLVATMLLAQNVISLHDRGDIILHIGQLCKFVEVAKCKTLNSVKPDWTLSYCTTSVQVLGSLSATRYLLCCLEGWCWWCRP